jgi:hypothetical protein
MRSHRGGRPHQGAAVPGARVEGGYATEWMIAPR